MTTEELRYRLRELYRDFQNNKSVTYEDYQSSVATLAKLNPEAFSEIQQQNTDASIDLRNATHMQPEVLPFDTQIADAVEERTTVPYGYETTDSLGAMGNYSILGMFRPELNKINLPGFADPATSQHEGFHAIVPKGDMKRGNLRRVTQNDKYAPEEYLAELHDMARGVLTENPDLTEEAMNSIKSRYDIHPQYIMEHLSTSINDLAGEIGISREDAARITENILNRDGYIFDHDGVTISPMSASDTIENLNSESMSEIVDAAAFAEDIRTDDLLDYIDINRNELLEF